MFGLKENFDFLGKMLMIVQGKLMRLVGFVVIVSRIGWVCVCVCFIRKFLVLGGKKML